MIRLNLIHPKLGNCTVAALKSVEDCDNATLQSLFDGKCTHKKLIG